MPRPPITLDPTARKYLNRFERAVVRYAIPAKEQSEREKDVAEYHEAKWRLMFLLMNDEEPDDAKN